MNIERTAKDVLDAIARAGCEGEAFVEDGRSTKVAVSRGRVESLEERRDRGVGIRVFKGGRTGFSFTADLSGAGIGLAVSRAKEIAAFVAPDPANRLPDDPGTPAEGMLLCDPGLADVPMPRKIEFALEAERSARASDPRVSGVRESAFQDSIGSCHVANTSGLSRGFAQSRAVVAIDLVATEGEESQTGWHGIWKLGAGGLDPAAVGRESARKAALKLGAARAKTAKTFVVLAPEVTASFFGELSGLFAADSILKGRSLLAGKMGERIASPAVTLVDDGRHPDGYATATIDGEGVATRRTVLVDRGILAGMMQSSYTAARTGAAVTGNAQRGGYSGRPAISRTNLFLEPTGIGAKDLLAGVPSGVYVTEVMGLHTINHVTGDFSIGAAGQAIDSGRIAGPIDQMAIAGQLISLLSSIEAVATDLEFILWGGGSTVLLKEISVSGT
jgi:PmbA protein